MIIRRRIKWVPWLSLCARALSGVNCSAPEVLLLLLLLPLGLYLEQQTSNQWSSVNVSARGRWHGLPRKKRIQVNVFVHWKEEKQWTNCGWTLTLNIKRTSSLFWLKYRRVLRYLCFMFCLYFCFLYLTQFGDSPLHWDSRKNCIHGGLKIYQLAYGMFHWVFFCLSSFYY